MLGITVGDVIVERTLLGNVYKLVADVNGGQFSYCAYLEADRGVVSKGEWHQSWSPKMRVADDAERSKIIDELKNQGYYFDFDSRQLVHSSEDIKGEKDKMINFVKGFNYDTISSYEVSKIYNMLNYFIDKGKLKEKKMIKGYS